MPLLYFDMIRGREPDEVRKLLDTAHAAMVEAFEVPERDRYQVVYSHPSDEIVTLDTGLGIDRSDQLVIIHVVSRRRTRAQKERLYALLADLVLVLHGLFILFVLLGGLIVWRRPRLGWVHLTSVAWAVWVAWAGWICPLTPLENALRRAGGPRPGVPATGGGGRLPGPRDRPDRQRRGGGARPGAAGDG